jgi:hypothetical protein
MLDDTKEYKESNYYNHSDDKSPDIRWSRFFFDYARYLLEDEEEAASLSSSSVYVYF